MASIDIFWNSGETCEVVGKYCFQCCHGKAEHQFVAGDVFPVCHHCGNKVKWHRPLAEVLPIDTIETGMKSGLKKARNRPGSLRKRR